MSAPQQERPIPSPLATTPPPDLYPPTARQLPAAPAPSGPPMLRALSGQLSSPLPVILAGVGLLLLGLAFFLPLGEYTWGGKAGSDPMSEFSLYGGELTRRVSLSVGEQPAIAALPFTVAAAIALAASRRWLTFGRLASAGLGILVIASEFGRAYLWKTDLQDSIDRLGSFDDIDEGFGFSKKALEDVNVDFGVGLWLFIAGAALLVAAVMVIRPANRPGFVTPPHVAPQHPPAYPQVNQVPPQRFQAPPTAAAPAPAAAPTDADRAVEVHDDPPSLSIYKPPKKDV
ncbi:hypothetical protein Snas_1022 [Stackebrandtia nassauensis DSM 44728]|uniref:Uncharacterized protein n=2 Tax=Stackebrandtia TaxID=283810 RepID=D3QA20_STANL|nr:hypothetical protein Snas_1022 [Stackebrandtia nassauensis DSM 44728]